MKTPICDFVKQYAESKTARMHMPGHKGKAFLGFEALDITEIKGADSLYEADGIIAESERNASALFGCKTFYSAEGSSLAIRAMLYLCELYAKSKNKKTLIYAGRNAHKSFINTIALLDVDIEWLDNGKDSSYLSFNIDCEALESKIKNSEQEPTAIYITSPDYLGNTADISAISKICKKYGILLLVDNAHGAYLKFLPDSIHPIDLGADMCCDSAHKTLPVLTGGAYLHISNNAPALLAESAKQALSLFGSTSPSYLILQSLDKANEYIAEDYKTRLLHNYDAIRNVKYTLTENGYSLIGDEPMKITVETKKYGYTGTEFADILRKYNIECEFADHDYVVFMLSAETSESEINTLERVLLSIEKRKMITTLPPKMILPKRVMSVREATMSPYEEIDAKDAFGRILAFSEVGCPPAVPIVVSGEIIDKDAISCFEYYGIERCRVVK